MAAETGSFPHRFWATLSYACSELCLIVLLQIAAVASYAATRVAAVRGLRAPCTLCSRLDRALHGKPWFSADLLCPAHRSEIASLAYCTSHARLAVARSEDLCKGCHLASTEDVVKNSRSRARSTPRRLCSCCSEEPFKNARNISEDDDAAEPPSYNNAHRHRSEETDGLSRIDATDSTLVMTPMVVVPGHHFPDHHHLNAKTFVAGTEEINGGSHNSPRRDEHGAAKENGGASANTGAAKAPADTASYAPSRIFVDRNSSVKNAFIGRLNLPSPRPSEIIFARDNSSTTHQQVKALLSQISSRGLDTSSSDGTPSPGVGVQPSESSAAMARRLSLERNYSVLEPSDGNGNLGDNIEGEASVESLRKQLELSRKSLATLYKELEEERSASAVAASQTMAMINRLQEEKAAMQMEALQYLRMMEEQANHDHEAIQDLHDLLTDREQELLDMDVELASCRRLLQNEPSNAGRFDGTHTMNSAGDGRNVAFQSMNDTDFVGNTMSYFEDEKAYILESLNRLEENLCIFTSRLASDDVKNTQVDMMLEDHTRDDGWCMENTQLPTHVQQQDKNEWPFSPSGNYEMNDLPSIKNAILLLKTRLKTLEVDQQFLKELLTSLTYGSDGLQCVQEATSHLAELRTVVTQRRAMALPLVHTIWS